MSALLLCLFFFYANLAQSESIGQVDGQPNASTGPSFSETCVNVCSKLISNPSPATAAIFKKNCESAKREADEISTLIGATKATGGIMMKIALVCVPNSIKKAGMGVWDLITFIFRADPRSEQERAARQRFLENCAKSQECSRATARQLARFHQRGPDGSFKVPDSEVDEYLKSVDYRRLTYQVQDELYRLRPICDSLYNTLSITVRETVEGDELTVRKEIYRRVAKEASYCPGVMGLMPPELELPKPQPTAKAEPPKGLDQLNYIEKLYVGYGCLGDDFEKAFWDACSEGGQYLVPIPVVGAAKLIGAGIKYVRLTRAELSAIKGAIPKGHTVISELETGILTKAVGSDGKTTYQIIGKDGVFDPQRVDPSGYAIMASNDAGRAMLEAHMMGGSKSVIMVDVNYLGKVNYLGGYAAGDEYMAGAAKIIADEVGSAGTIYRWGGDEFQIVYNTTDKVVINRIAQRISQRLVDDPVMKNIFRQFKKDNAVVYRQMMKAKSIDDMPKDVVAKWQMSDAEMALARSDFPKFKEQFKVVYLAKLKESSRMHPSGSVSSAVADGRSPKQVQNFLEEGAAKSKTEYKRCLGLDVKKYIDRDSFLPPEMQVKNPGSSKCRPVLVPTF